MTQQNSPPSLSARAPGAFPLPERPPGEGGEAVHGPQDIQREFEECWKAIRERMTRAGEGA